MFSKVLLIIFMFIVGTLGTFIPVALGTDDIENTEVSNSVNEIEENTVTNETQETEESVKKEIKEEKKEEKKKEKSVTEEKYTATMYANSDCNLRKSYTTSSEKIGYLKINDEVKVIAKTSNGWYKISFQNGTAYVKATLLTENKIEEKNEQSTNELYKQIEEEIGTLPEVGHNIADDFYLLITIVALLGLGATMYIKKNNEE